MDDMQEIADHNLTIMLMPLAIATGLTIEQVKADWMRASYDARRYLVDVLTTGNHPEDVSGSSARG